MTIINATPQDENANSYLTVEEATSYFAGKFGADAWSGFDADTKEKLLISSTRQIDSFVFSGLKTDLDQALQWPRTNIVDRDGRTVSSAVNPKKLKDAACELAYWYWTEEDRVLTDTELQQVDTYKVGPLDVKVAANKLIFPKQVEQLLNSIGPGVLVSTSGVSAPGPTSSQSVRFSR